MIGQAYGERVTVGIVAAVCAVMLIATAAIYILARTGRVRDPLKRELWLRLRSWAIILPAMLGPVLLGRAWLIAAVTLLGILCLREYDRATGLFRETTMVAGVVAGILLINFAALDHWYGFFTALFPLTVIGLAVISLPLDRPGGYIQRTGLGVFAFTLFGAGLAHLGYMGNDPGYRPLVLLLLTAVAVNDVFAFTAGKLLGGPKLLPATSPNKTISGALGALAGTVPIVAVIAWPIFSGTLLDRWYLLVGLGVIVSVAGQAGDLMLSSIKRDLGIKDMGVIIPGHGGLLDRFNSLLLVAPATFHYVGYYVGFGLYEPTRIYTG